jgi:hypothetical protein
LSPNTINPTGMSACFDSAFPLQEAMHHQCVPLHICY